MKRALTAAAFAGLVAVFVPQAAFGDHPGDHKADCAGQPAAAPDSPEQAPPQQNPHGDREQEHSDGGEILF
jgi:hypothetical protein